MRWQSFCGTDLACSSIPLQSADVWKPFDDRKMARQIARQRNPDRRDFYLHMTSTIFSWQRIYADESGCHKRDGFRSTGWSHVGVTAESLDTSNRYQRLKLVRISLLLKPRCTVPPEVSKSLVQSLAMAWFFLCLGPTSV